MQSREGQFNSSATQS
nr:unnamed protein product [Callosobruchus chinensis]